ncbi:hypothetical protein RSSM_04516 [Rhodopirellula sallentina SM41]|uniref:Uncharacterized protein n=1 Tax=Rhodopirellula sallentina SM41 TaxID=1263870 RepID=M5U847_9BACT|nr:hypothetical protein RSSM_04516 [Rhodopirellula sallentina SM41]
MAGMKPIPPDRTWGSITTQLVAVRGMLKDTVLPRKLHTSGRDTCENSSSLHRPCREPSAIPTLGQRCPSFFSMSEIPLKTH